MKSISSDRQRPPDLGEAQSEQADQRHLRSEGLRGGDADLHPAARVERRLRLPRDLRPHEVRDRERPRPALARELDRIDGVARLARLGDPDHERVLREHRVAVDPLARDVRLDRDAGPLLEDVAADDSGVVGGAAGDDHDPAQVADLELGQAERLEHQLVAANAIADRLGHGLGLLEDLLEHERLVAALLGALLVPVDLLPLGRLDLGAVDEEANAVRRHLDHLAVRRVDDGAGLAEEGGDRGGEEVLTVSEPYDERCLVAHAGEQVGLVVMDGDDREVPFELRIDAAERPREVAVVLLLEQVDDRLGVGLGGERVAALGQLLAQLDVVLDDPVEDDGQAAGLAACERMGVPLGDAAVRRPARVAEPVTRMGAVRACRLHQVAEVADGADVVERVVLAQRDPGGVVASVFEPAQAFEQKRLRVARPDVSDDSAHVCSFPRWARKTLPGNTKSPAS